MKCSECFHKDACGEASMYNDADQCKNAYPASYIKGLEDEAAKLKRDVVLAKEETSRAHGEYRTAVRYIAELDDALTKSNFILAGRILERWYRRNDGA